MKFTAQVVFSDTQQTARHEEPLAPLIRSVLAALKERDPELVNQILKDVSDTSQVVGL